jgi:hypothetical protein
VDLRSSLRRRDNRQTPGCCDLSFSVNTFAAARLDRTADLAAFDGTVLNALREAEDALDHYQHDLQRAASLRAAAARSTQALSVA